MSETNQTAVMIANIVPLIFVFAVFYFLVIRPQQKTRKEHEGMLKGLDKNDEIVTSSGIHGTIVGIKDDTVLLRIADNVKIEIQKSAIASRKKN
ncbi:MAG: preprotein translocase subunit YajC [Candidatus Omnitrophica bacterium]|nr:preprotein translocase subunit YajC [Candidatus Omnitrophota bacterium]